MKTVGSTFANSLLCFQIVCSICCRSITPVFLFSTIFLSFFFYYPLTSYLLLLTSYFLHLTSYFVRIFAKVAIMVAIEAIPEPRVTVSAVVILLIDF